jgi:hypothetical protein
MDTVEGSAPSKTKERDCTQSKSNECRSTDHSWKFDPTHWKSRMMVITLNWDPMREPLAMSSLKMGAAKGIGE